MVLGVKLIDEQHHHLVELINGFGRAMLDGRGGKDLMQLFGDLANYVHVHFSSEEVLMDKNDYPDAETHRMLHREFTGQLAEFILEFQEGNKMLRLKCTATCAIGLSITFRIIPRMPTGNWLPSCGERNTLTTKGGQMAALVSFRLPVFVTVLPLRAPRRQNLRSSRPLPYARFRGRV